MRRWRTLTWPFAKYFPFDNIIFGEPSLAFGTLLLAAALLLWKRAAVLSASERPAALLARDTGPLSIFIFGMGLALVAIAVAGMVFQLFAAPPEEPISGLFAQWPWVEATFMSLLFFAAGVGALFLPFGLRALERADGIHWTQVVCGIALGGSGLAFLLFGALNFFTHIGLIIHTM